MKHVTASALILIVALLVLAARSHASLRYDVPEVSQASGAAIYGRKCASCHGKDGRAKTFKAKFNSARNLTDPQWQSEVSNERLFNSIMNGRGRMPAFGKKLPEAEINSLVTHVRSLKG